MMTKVLYRPVNRKELNLIQELNWKAFPKRLPEQPFFYPVMNQEYASKITREWNLKSYGNGFVTKFSLPVSFLSKYEIRNVGDETHNELWIPANKLEEFNNKIIGKIEVIEAYDISIGFIYLYIIDIFSITNLGSVIMVRLINLEDSLKITKNSKLNGYKLMSFIDSPRKLDKKGDLISNIFVLRLDDDKNIAFFEKNTIAIFENN